MSEDEQKLPKVALPEQPASGSEIARVEEQPAASHPEAKQSDDSMTAGPASEQSTMQVDLESSDQGVAEEPVAEQSPIQADGEEVQLQEVAQEPPTTEVERAVDTAAADAEVLAVSRRHTRRSFVVAGIGTAAAYGFYHYLGATDSAEMQPPPLRDAYQLNASVSRGLFRNTELAPTYPLSRAEIMRINGIFGLKMDLELESWRLQLVGMRGAALHPRYVKDVTAWEYKYKAPPENADKGHDTKVDPKIATAKNMAPESMQAKAEEDENHTGRTPRGKEEAGESNSTLPPNTPGLLLRMQDITTLPRQELVTQFKCIEGWSQIVHWAGVRMADFLELYPPEKIDDKDPRYVYMETPDGDYYTGYDLDVMHHPQTLLVTDMMGAPLTQPHGAPLRLHMPTKYGYKQIKRIGLIAYTNDKPDDYWTKLGYDWYAGL
jgi:hypothetical protein